MSQGLLLFAAIVLSAIGAMHSFLGERYVFRRLFALPDLPLLRRDRRYTERILRFAWHLTSLAWWGFAALLVVLALAPEARSLLTGVIAATLLLSGALILATAGTRHPAWLLFLLAGGAALYAAW